MTWYGTGRLRKGAVHAHPDCPKLHDGRVRPVRELDDTYFRVTYLCKTCFSGQISSVHARCTTCGHKTTWPCPHNGGVQVQGRTRMVWVWPEDVAVRTIVNPRQLC
jgi:hypothetical protein